MSLPVYSQSASRAPSTDSCRGAERIKKLPLRGTQFDAFHDWHSASFEVRKLRSILRTVALVQTPLALTEFSLSHCTVPLTKMRQLALLFSPLVHRQDFCRTQTPHAGHHQRVRNRTAVNLFTCSSRRRKSGLRPSCKTRSFRAACPSQGEATNTSPRLPFPRWRSSSSLARAGSPSCL